MGLICHCLFQMRELFHKTNWIKLLMTLTNKSTLKLGRGIVVYTWHCNLFQYVLCNYKTFYSRWGRGVGGHLLVVWFFT